VTKNDTLWGWMNSLAVKITASKSTIIANKKFFCTIEYINRNKPIAGATIYQTGPRRCFSKDGNSQFKSFWA
jgi:hypothetical protein